MDHKFGIIGGGISGCSVAYYLRKQFPKCSISIFEKESKMGGWLQTKKEKYEQGARLIKNDVNAKGFYEISQFAGVNLMGSNKVCKQLLNEKLEQMSSTRSTYEKMNAQNIQI